MTTSTPSHSTVSYEAIKLGIDAHAQYYWVSRQVDGATPQPVQKMAYEERMRFVVKQQKHMGKVWRCKSPFSNFWRSRRGARSSFSKRLRSRNFRSEVDR